MAYPSPFSSFTEQSALRRFCPRPFLSFLLHAREKTEALAATKPGSPEDGRAPSPEK